MDHLNFLRTKKDGGWLDLAINSQKTNAPVLASLRTRLENTYSTYLSIIQNPCNSPSPSKFIPDSKLLKDFYERPPKELSLKISERRDNHGLNSCPSCGNPYSPNTLDHFMPKDLWPEFSIYPNNLVPQCDRCAPRKSTNYFCTTQNDAIYIHPIFFDSLSKIGFKVNIKMHGKRPEFDIEFIKNQTIPPLETGRIKVHLAKLEVESRAKLFCLREYQKWKRMMKANKFDIEEAFKQRLKERPDNGHFPKDWKTAFYKGVLSCPALINHLHSLAPSQSNQSASFISTL